MDFLVKLAEGFTGIFNAGGENLVGLITGILPTLIVLLTFVNSVVAMIGEERVTRFARKTTKFFILRYTLFPFLAVFVFNEPDVLYFWTFFTRKTKASFL